MNEHEQEPQARATQPGDHPGQPSRSMSRGRSWMIAGAMAMGAAIGGAGIAGALTNAVTDDSASVQSAQTESDGSQGTENGQGARPERDPSQPGPGEELLTGDLAERVTAAAQAAEPDATIERVETDAHGAAYEAHVVRADGTRITLTFDEDLNLVETIEGCQGGGGPHGPRGPHGPHGPHGPGMRGDDTTGSDSSDSTDSTADNTEASSNA